MKTLYSLGCILLAALVASCAKERPAIDRVQPNVLAKSTLAGEWYYQRTVVDMPAGENFTFVGATDLGGLSRVRWEIQENMLYARRSTESVVGTDLKKEQGERYLGEVVAAFPIQKHFDISNAYNTTTGEKINVIEENDRDRPWHEREYVRVDWSVNRVQNYDLDFERASVEAVPYYVQEIDPATGERHKDAPHFAPDGSYFDITNKIFAKPGSVNLPGYGEIPLCWLRGHEFSQCGPGEYTLRNSFMKVSPERQYEPMPYKGRPTEMFGYFQTSRMVYDPKTGIREQGKERYLNRHNIWKRWFDDEGKPLPYAQRELRPVVYYANDEMPDWLKPVGQEVADQWNRVFTDAVESLGYPLKEGERVFVFCPNNPVQEGDHPACGAPGLAPRLGDIRYSFMAYVPKFMTYGLLGFGPSNIDPETGEILSGMAYVYHHNNLATYATQEMVELLNGSKRPDQFIDGVDLTEWINTVNHGKKSEQTYALADAQHFVKTLTTRPSARYWDSLRQAPSMAEVKLQTDKGFDAFIAPYLNDMYQRGIHNGERQLSASRLRALKGTAIEDLLLNKELLLAFGQTPGAALSDDQKALVSVARGGLGQRLKEQAKLREAFAEARNYYTRDMADDALLGIAKELKGRPAGEVYELLRKTIYTAVLAHEVGHTVGLMHNFGASDDAVNYHDEYWKLRDDGNVGPRLLDPMTQKEIDGKLYNYGYSSIMDYAGRYTIDGQGIGKYDRAAILYGYANKVEVFKDRGPLPHQWLRDWFERDGELVYFMNTGPQAVHYTTLYKQLGPKLYDRNNRQLVDASALSEDLSTATVNGQALTRVPYIYCSHSRSNLSDHCLTRDAGADSYERMKNILDDLDTWYIVRNFPRGKVGVDQSQYVGTWYGRIYHRLKSWHDLYGLYADLLPRFYDANVMQQFYADPTNGWGAKTWAVQNAFNQLMKTVMMPDVGSYSRPLLQPDGTALMRTGYGAPIANIGIDKARYFSTSWSDGTRQCGYTWWECLHHIGFYLDKVMAIEALSDSETNFVARSTPEDIRQWEVSYYSTFTEQIRKLNTAILSGNFAQVGPYWDNGELKFPNYAGALSDTRTSPVDPYATFSVQLYWQVLGQARFFDNFDQSFRDDSRLFIRGTGSEPSVPEDEVTTFRDPLTGMRYGALRTASTTGARALLDRANKLLATSTYCDSVSRTPSQDDDCRNRVPNVPPEMADRELLSTLDLIKVMADLTPIMQFGDPRSP